MTSNEHHYAVPFVGHLEDGKPTFYIHNAMTEEKFKCDCGCMLFFKLEAVERDESAGELADITEFKPGYDCVLCRQVYEAYNNVSQTIT